MNKVEKEKIITGLNPLPLHVWDHSDINFGVYPKLHFQVGSVKFELVYLAGGLFLYYTKDCFCA